MPGSRTIVVTGATSGIGAATAALLMENGETVIGADVNEPAAGTVDEFVYMDQSDPASIEAAISAMPEGLDGLVNSAGVPPADRYPPVHVVKTNFFGLREFTHKLLGKISEGGAIVNLASAAGMGWAQNIALLKEALAITDIDEVDDFVARHQIHNEGMDNLASYPLSKQLLIVWTATAFSIWKDAGVRMNAVAPSGVATPILDDFLQAFGEAAAERMQAIGASTPEDVAKVAVLLLDPRFDWINGTTIPVERGAITYRGISSLGLAE